MRPITLTWPFPSLVRLGWATAGAPNPDPARALGCVYLLLGQGVVFSRGFGQMCGALRRAGCWAEDLRCVGGLWLGRHLRQEQQAGRLQCPLADIENVYLDAIASPIQEPRLDHFNITREPAVQKWILGRVLGESRCE